MKDAANTTLGLSTSTDAKEADSLSYLQMMEEFPIPGSPFIVVRMENRFHIHWGMFRLTEAMSSYEECVEYMEEEKWNFLAAVIVAIQAAGELYNNKNNENAGSEGVDTIDGI